MNNIFLIPPASRLERDEMARRDMRFDVVDYIIFALLLLFSAAIGLFYGFIDKIKQRKKGSAGVPIDQPKSSAKEYLLANKSMGVGYREGLCPRSTSVPCGLDLSHSHEFTGEFHVRYNDPGYACRDLCLRYTILDHW